MHVFTGSRKKQKGEEDEAVYHGVCYMGATPLLYPGTASVNGNAVLLSAF